MPYKNIKDRRACYKRWYYKHYPESKNKILENKTEWRNKNRQHYLEEGRKEHRRRSDKYISEGRCIKCGKKIEEDEIVSYGKRNKCEACQTIVRERMRWRHVGLKFNRVV